MTMPITITITDPTPEQIAALFGGGTEEARNALSGGAYRELQIDDGKPTAAFADKPKATRAKPTPKAEVMSPEDAELAADIARDIAEAPPEPKGAQVVVDGGTGKPIEQTVLSAEPVSLTMDEVRANATRLAQADSARLKAILNSFGAAKLSEVKPDDLPDFAGQVLAALG